VTKDIDSRTPVSHFPISLMLVPTFWMAAESLTFQALNSLNVQRRVILSGTPIQNDLSEYFSLLNFANPNFLGTKGDFRKNFENAIIRGRDADATDKVKEECEKKLKELGGLVTKFIIRRTNDLLSKYCGFTCSCHSKPSVHRYIRLQCP
jgi:hypothetical protein